MAKFGDKPEIQFLGEHQALVSLQQQSGSQVAALILILSCTVSRTINEVVWFSGETRKRLGVRLGQKSRPDGLDLFCRLLIGYPIIHCLFWGSMVP